MSRDDLEIILRQLCGTCLKDEELTEIVHRVFEAAGESDVLSEEFFLNVFQDMELNMAVEFPVYMASM